MTLPAYFLADLPSDAELTAQLIVEASQTLKQPGALQPTDPPRNWLLCSIRSPATGSIPVSAAAIGAGGAGRPRVLAETLATGLDDFPAIDGGESPPVTAAGPGRCGSIGSSVVLDSTGEPRRRTLAGANFWFTSPPAICRIPP